MRKLKGLIAGGLVIAYLAAPVAVMSADAKNEKAEKAEKVEKAEKAEKPEKGKKAYPLKTCLVSDEELGSMGKPFVFAHKGQEIKLCCKSCQKDFKKDTAKYMKKIEKAEKEKKAKAQS